MPESVAAQEFPCSALAQNLFVRQVMSDLYLWRRTMPSLDPADFESPGSLLEALRLRDLDQNFSYITTKAANDALVQRSEFVGLGFSAVWVDGHLLVSQVYPASPASDAELRRGDELVEIDGRSVSHLAGGGLDQALGPPVVGLRVQVAYLRGEEHLATTMIKRAVTIPTVSNTSVFTLGGRHVGYLFLRNFVEPSVPALDAAFVAFRQKTVTDLILDLRYNPGGLVTVARHLAGLIGGPYTGGQVFARYHHNDRNHFRDHVIRFPSLEQSLGLRRLFVITSRASASASELLINALRPFMPVVLIGDRTFGKPVGQYSVEFCDKVIAPVAFSLRNANGEGDFFSGLQPTCIARDDLERPIGAPDEASLAEALHVLSVGRCSAQPPGRVPQSSTSSRSGLFSVVAAH